MEISTGQRGKLTDCLRSALFIYARMNSSRVLGGGRWMWQRAWAPFSDVFHLEDDSRALSFISEYQRGTSASWSRIIWLQNVRQQTRPWYSHNALKVDAQPRMARVRLLCAPYRTIAEHYSSPHAFYSYPEQSIYTQVNVKPSKTIGVPLKAWWLLK